MDLKELYAKSDYKDKNGMLFNCDAMSLFKDIEDNSIDLIITDPPYRVVSGGKPKSKGQPSGMLSKNDGKIFKHNSIKVEEWMPECYRVLKNNSHCYVYTNVINMENYLKTARLTGFKLHNICAWVKNNCTPNRWYMNNGEYVLFLRKGCAKSINNKSDKRFQELDDVEDCLKYSRFTKVNNISNKSHPCEKPVQYLKMQILNSSNEDDIVFDPFGGVFSTPRACIETNRRYISCEIDKEYFDKGVKLIKDFK